VLDTRVVRSAVELNWNIESLAEDVWSTDTMIIHGPNSSIGMLRFDTSVMM
jgi:hypothetical protein